ncbi:signal peptidase I [Flammeovirgaceae bacterium SG7u.111]|nr:signal peptidase I [Flammeovirgaceae bacterium SG7u.132]WPO37697.1 signal peptidase I [Flammeovirgaceae bacterium SG7u.111]
MKLALFKKKESKKKGPLREWFDAIVFAVVAATIIRWLFIEAFTIPTPSMEKSLLVGDFLFVSKMHYGARTPKTPLQVPLTHQKIWGTEIPSYLDWIQLPQYRLPGISSVKNNDVVVFNYPPDNYPVDLKTNYIKRCMGIPGDNLEIKNKEVFINGEKLPMPEHSQTSYEVNTTEMVNEQRVFFSRDITDVSGRNTGTNYVVMTSAEKAEELEKLPFIKSTEEIVYNKGEMRGSDVFPHSPNFDWTLDNFGPLWIPKEGSEIEINETNLTLYEEIIKKYEGHEDVKVEGGKLLIDGNEVAKYTFEQDYYFMMGDNRHNSLDSRIWAFVPADHILGKGLLIWWSVDPNTANGNIFKRVRWERIFDIIE